MKKYILDIVAVGGALSLGGGLWMIRPSIMFVVMGIVLIAAAIYGARR